MSKKDKNKTSGDSNPSSPSTLKSPNSVKSPSSASIKSPLTPLSSTKVKPAQSLNIRHILCEKFSRKEEALDKIKGGQKFDDVAREFSEDKARQGGALGWKTKTELLEDFWNAADKLEVSTTAAPQIGEAKTEEGYHLIMVEGRK